MKGVFFILFFCFIQQAFAQDTVAINKIDSLLLLQAAAFKATSETQTTKVYFPDSTLAQKDMYLFDKGKQALLFTLHLHNSEIWAEHGVNQFYVLSYFLNNQLVKTEVYCTRCFNKPAIDTFYFSDGRLISKELKSYFQKEYLVEVATRQLGYFKTTILKP